MEEMKSYLNDGPLCRHTIIRVLSVMHNTWTN